MGFSAEWLALREPADVRARDPGLMGMAAVFAAARGGVVMDLGCGTGALARAMGPRLPGARWRMVDGDAGLLARAAQTPGARAIEADLGDLDALPFGGVGLVACTALLDLMPADWAMRLARHVSDVQAGFYAALSYTGVMAFDPPHPGDAAVTAAFNRHQAGDKGLGPAMGPESVRATAAAFSAAGFAVEAAPSPWRIGPDEAPLREALLDGIAQAASEAGCAEAAVWRQMPRESCRVGHADLLALPP